MALNPFDLSDAMLRQVVRLMSPSALRGQLTQLADTLGDEAFGAKMAREIVARTRPEQAIPDTYAPYRTLVRDGIEFFLGRIHRQRLIDLVVSQLTMDADACCQARLLALAQRFPTLHKLGQIIARHPDIDPAVRQWLVNLENGLYGTPSDELFTRIRGALGPAGGSVSMAPGVLAEASVGAVIPFHWQPSANGPSRHGVFKVLRPGIRRHLNEELAILEETAVFFHDHRTRYPLKDFRFLEIFKDVREMMVNEIDLAAEQRLLKEAGRFYAEMPEIRVPGCLGLSTDVMTAMDFLDGPKLADAELTEAQRRRLAESLFSAVVLTPLFSRREAALFHGDPHAGNILAVFTPESTDPAIGLVDWSLAGHLARGDRVKTMRMIQAILKRDLTGMCDAIHALALNAFPATTASRRSLRKLIAGWMQDPENGRLPLVKQVFRLLEALSMEGLVFPADLMLFRKSIFTLEGVVHDLWPAFDMNAAIARYVVSLLLREMPFRLGNLLFPFADGPEDYLSLMSNQDLQSLLTHQFTGALFTHSQRLMEPLTFWSRALGVA